jgi:two-component system response regulator PilR (NtrC family)
MARLAKHTSVPQIPPPPSAFAAHEQVAARRPVLLWIDDFEPGLALYQVMFERLGFLVLTASSGQMGLKLAEQHPVDVVVTDFEMPHMNGEAVATAIKASKPGTPVVLFTGSTLVPQSARRAVDACCDKAGSRDQLLATLNRLLHKKHTRTLQPPPSAPASHDRHRTVA